MKSDKVPFLKNEDVLVVPLHGELNDREINQFENNLLEKCSKDQKVRGVVLDISSLESVDLFAARMLLRVASKLSLMDLNSVVVGLRPEVAITLVEMGLTFPGLRTAINLEHGIQVLKQLRQS